ncbi:MAG: hypothetical protein FAZ92_03681 [Accumulibacter sp.]|nr:MAG: hypothetical protein FAZ92_03681 [Accumulibacter sp.]
MSRNIRGMPARPDPAADPLHPADRRGTDDGRTLHRHASLLRPHTNPPSSPNGAKALNFRQAVPLGNSYARLLENP